MVSLLHSVCLRGSLEGYLAVDRKAGEYAGRSQVTFRIQPAHVEGGPRSGYPKQRLLSRRKFRISKSLRTGSLFLSSPAVGTLNGDGSCSCGGRSQFLGKRLSPRIQSAVLGTRITERQWRGRLARNPYMSESSDLADKQLRPFRRSKSGGLVRNSRSFRGSLASVDRRERHSRSQCSHVWKSCQRNLITAAAVAGLSLCLCSSALASPTSTAIASIPKYMQEDVERQLMYQLQAEIKVQRDWLEDFGQPLREWSIDDHIKEKLFVGGEGKSGTKLDESGKAVTTHTVESIVVPLFKPSAVVARIEKTDIGQDNSPSSQTSSKSLPAVAGSSYSVPATKSTTTHLSTADGAELVAVTAVPLGSVVSAASGSVASIGGAAVATALSASPVPGMGLLRRIMMHFSGGGLAGAMGATIVYPLDTIKTRMQVQKTKDGEKPHYKDEMDCLLQVVTEEGMGALYTGLVPQLIGIAPEKAIKLTVNEILLEMLESEMPGVGVVLLELLAGSGGGFSQVVFTNPMEAVKVRLQTQPKDSKAKNMWQVVKELGLQGLYNGSFVTLARDVPSTGIFFAGYTYIRQMYPEQSFMAGCIAAIPATVLVTPMDVVKTRMQMETTGGEEQYENAWHCFTEILRKEGPGALFKGSGARVLKTSPQFGITLMLYNMICHLE